MAHALEAALWCIGRTADFESAILTAANLGDDADTTAAIAGQLAGALYGRSGISRHWLERLAERESVEARANALFEHSLVSVGLGTRAAATRPETPQLSEQQTRLQRLVADGAVRMIWAPEVMERPAPVAACAGIADRIRGMLLGLAIGDALGNTSEGMLPSDRHSRYGEIRYFLPNHHAGGREVGLPSDDTQLAFWTLVR